MKDFFKNKRPHNGLTYDEFSRLSEEKIINTNINDLSEEEKHLFDYSKLNFHRMTRINKTYSVSPELTEKLVGIVKPQLWMMITEDWCGDSAQTMPYFHKFAQINPVITLRIIERDKNLDIMDNYLTNGKSRSIPKLVAFDEDGNEIFIWGPRPKEAELLINQWKSEGLEKEEFIEKLHLWYGRNRGKAIEQEFLELLNS